jgi:hypothetical protein
LINRKIAAGKTLTIMALMVVDGGMKGFEQSFHHPQFGQSAYNADATNMQQFSEKRISRINNAMNLTNAMNDIIKLMNDDKKKVSRRIIERLVWNNLVSKWVIRVKALGLS